MSSLYPGNRPHQPVHCMDCGHEYPQDPPFEVQCPDCHASPGSYCKRASGHSGPLIPFHAARDLLADRMGFYACDCPPKTPKIKIQQSSFFEDDL